MKSRKWIIIFMFALLAVSASMAITGTSLADIANAGIITVPKDYSSIQEAVDRADPGDTVRIWAGTYYENIAVDKVLTIIGNGTGITVIESSEMYTMQLESNGIYVSRLTVTGKGFRGLNLYASWCVIEKLSCTGQQYGLLMAYGSNNIISNSTFSNSGFDGIYINGGSHNRFSNCTISDNGQRGVQLIGYSSNNTFENVTCTGHSLYGFISEYGNNIVIRNSTFSRNSGRGLTLRGGHTNIIINCRIEENSNIYAGALFQQCIDLRIINCTIDDNYGDGLQIGSVTGLQMSGCSVRGNNGEGLASDWGGGSWWKIENNTIQGNDLTGLRLFDLTDSIIANNTIAANQIGVELDGTSTHFNTTRNIIVGNMIEANLGYGIDIGQFGVRNTFYHNNIINNTNQVSSTHPEDIFDDGSLGNYWSDYRARYPNAKIVGKVWDTPYDVAITGVLDRYPLALLYDSRSPVADAGANRRIPLNTSHDLDGRDSTDDIAIANYTWSFIYNDVPIELYGARATHRFEIIGLYTITLIVMDAWGNSDSDTATLDVFDNIPPIAEAGNDINVPMGDEFFLNGTASTDNVDIVRYSWTIDPGGLNLTLEGVIVRVSVEEAGNYTAILNVSDIEGNWATDILIVHVIDTEPPIASAGPDTEVAQVTRVTFNGTLSSDNILIVSWMWTFDYNGEQIHLDGMVCSYLFSLAGEYTIALTIADQRGNTATDTMVVLVRDTEKPVAVAGNDIEADQETQVLLDGLASTDNVGVTGYNWTFLYGGSFEILLGGEVSFHFADVGIYEITLTVMDAAGNWATDSILLSIRDSTRPESEAGENQYVGQNIQVILDGSGSSDNMGIANYSWTFSIAGEVVELYGPTAEYSFQKVGRYNITLEVKDYEGNSGTDTLTIEVLDTEAPNAMAGGDLTLIATQNAFFNASNSGDNVGIVLFTWTFEYSGEAVELDGISSSFRFDEAGDYEVALTVRDAAGNDASDPFIVHVLPLERDWRMGPFLDVGGNPVKGAGVNVEYNGTAYVGITDPNGFVEMKVVRYDLVSPAIVTASKDRWKTLKFEMPLDSSGNPSGEIPRMSREDEQEGASWAFLVVIAISIIVLITVVIWLGRGRRPVAVEGFSASPGDSDSGSTHSEKENDGLKTDEYDTNLNSARYLSNSNEGEYHQKRVMIS